MQIFKNHTNLILISTCFFMVFLLLSCSTKPTSPEEFKYSISGKVTGTDSVLIYIESIHRKCMTDINGVFLISDLLHGRYMLRPFKTGFTFIPPESIVIVKDANVQEINFAALVGKFQAICRINNIFDPPNNLLFSVDTARGNGLDKDTAIATVKEKIDNQWVLKFIDTIFSKSGEFFIDSVFAWDSVQVILNCKAKFFDYSLNSEVRKQDSLDSAPDTLQFVMAPEDGYIVYIYSQERRRKVSGTVKGIQHGTSVAVAVTKSSATLAAISTDTAGSFSFTIPNNTEYTLKIQSSYYSGSDSKILKNTDTLKDTVINSIALVKTASDIWGTVQGKKDVSFVLYDNNNSPVDTVVASTVNADSSYNYVFNAVRLGSYAIQPLPISLFNFYPNRITSVTVGVSDDTVPPFIAESIGVHISGDIIGIAKAGITVKLASYCTSLVMLTTTDSAGHFMFNNLLPNCIYSLEPILTQDISFSPAETSLSVGGNSIQGIIFQSKKPMAAIKGTAVLRNNSGGAAAQESVKVYLTSISSYYHINDTVITDSTGYYRFDSLPIYNSYVISYEKQGFFIDSAATRTITLISSDTIILDTVSVYKCYSLGDIGASGMDTVKYNCGSGVLSSVDTVEIEVALDSSFYKNLKYDFFFKDTLIKPETLIDDTLKVINGKYLITVKKINNYPDTCTFLRNHVFVDAINEVMIADKDTFGFIFILQDTVK